MTLRSAIGRGLRPVGIFILCLGLVAWFTALAWWHERRA